MGSCPVHLEMLRITLTVLSVIMVTMTLRVSAAPGAESRRNPSKSSGPLCFRTNGWCTNLSTLGTAVWPNPPEGVWECHLLGGNCGDIYDPQTTVGWSTGGCHCNVEN